MALRDTHRRRPITRRALLLLGGQLVISGLLAHRMYDLGVRQSEKFRLLSEENRINLRLIAPQRGMIYERSGKLIAQNIPNFKISMTREQSVEPAKVLRDLSQLIDLGPEEQEDILAALGRQSAFVPVTIKDDLSWEDFTRVSSNAPALPGITPEIGYDRSYPFAEAFSHLVGYVGPVSDYDLSKIDDDDPLLRIPRFQIGKNGVEYRTEAALRGKAGHQQIEVNAMGRVMRELSATPPVPGQNIQITVDEGLQAAVLERIARSGLEAVATTLMDVATGDILAQASTPGFDPNLFVRGISSADWRALNENIYRPLADKTVSGLYPPASTFKMVVALAALEAGVIAPQEEITCKGHIELFSRRFHCWKGSGHGPMSLTESLRHSCDIYYYEIAQRVGIEKIAKMANRLGLGIRHELPLRAVRSGTMPTPAWKAEAYGKEWVVGDTVNVGIGQGFTLATPLQLAVMTARIATGRAVEPQLIHSIDAIPRAEAPAEALGINPAHLDVVRRGMYEVVNNRRGTAYGARITDPAHIMAGKTGTAQIRQISAREREQGVRRNEDLPWALRDHALFVAYAPYNAPRFAISVVAEHGGGGSAAAAPLARDILGLAFTYAKDAQDQQPHAGQDGRTPQGRQTG